jgi:hypothetical protein
MPPIMNPLVEGSSRVHSRQVGRQQPVCVGCSSAYRALTTITSHQSKQWHAAPLKPCNVDNDQSSQQNLGAAALKLKPPGLDRQFFFQYPTATDSKLKGHCFRIVLCILIPETRSHLIPNTLQEQSKTLNSPEALDSWVPADMWQVEPRQDGLAGIPSREATTRCRTQAVICSCSPNLFG